MITSTGMFRPSLARLSPALAHSFQPTTLPPHLIFVLIFNFVLIPNSFFVVVDSSFDDAPLPRRKNNEHEHFDAKRSKSKEDCASLTLFGSHLGPNIKNIGITLGALWVSLDRKSKDAACRVVH